MMIRIFCRGIFLTLFWLMSQQSALALAEVKSSTIVSNSTITLGDLFDNLESGHDIWVMNAPAPGKKTTISTRYLASLTRQHNVYWQNSRNVQHITVTRRGKSIKISKLKPLIKKRLAELYPDSRKKGISFKNNNQTIHLPEEGTLEDITIEIVKYSGQRESFSAQATVSHENNDTTSSIIRGRTYTESYVPTLKKPLLPGSIIKNKDITWIAIPTLRIGRNIIRNKKQLIGMSSRRGLKALIPIKLSDLKNPQIITRGKPVTITFQLGKITLTAIGKAIENGGRGDVIRVMNIKSHNTIEAIITGPNQVQVITTQTGIAQLNASR